LEVNAPAVAVKVAVVEPAGTVTVAGVVRAVVLLASVVTAPPVAAAALRVTVHVTLALGATAPLAQAREETSTGTFKESDALAEEPLSEAVTVAV
jgi:hypothetical protein